MKKLLMEYLRTNRLSLLKSLIVFLSVTSFIGPVAIEVMQAKVEVGEQLGVEKEAAVFAVRSYESIKIMDLLYTQGARECVFNFPPHDLAEYVRFRSQNEDHQRGLAKAGREASAQDGSGMDDTGWLTMQQEAKLKELLAVYQTMADQHLGAPAVAAAWNKHLSDQAKYARKFSTAIGLARLLGVFVLGWLLAAFWVSIYISVKTRSLGFKLWCEWVSGRIPFASMLIFFSLIVDIFPLGKPADQLRMIKRAASIYLAGIMSLFAAAIGNAQTAVTKTTKKANVVVIDFRESGLIAGGSSPNSETTLRLYLSDSTWFAEVAGVARADREIGSVTGGRWLRPNANTEVGPYFGARAVAVHGKPTDMSLVAGTKLMVQQPVSKRFSLSLLVPAFQIEHSTCTGKNSFASTFQALTTYKPLGLSGGVEHSFRQLFGAAPTTYTGPVGSKKFKGTGWLKSWVAEVGVFHESIGSWRARGRLIFNFGF